MTPIWWNMRNPISWWKRPQEIRKREIYYVYVNVPSCIWCMYGHRRALIIIYILAGRGGVIEFPRIVNHVFPQSITCVAGNQSQTWRMTSRKGQRNVWSNLKQGNKHEGYLSIFIYICMSVQYAFLFLLQYVFTLYIQS